MANTVVAGHPRNWTKRDFPGWLPAPDRAEEGKTTAATAMADAAAQATGRGPFAADVAPYRLHLAAENKAEKTIGIYAAAVCWFAAAHLVQETDKTRWEQVNGHDVCRWMVWLLSRYRDACAYRQFRALRQLFRWLAVEDGIADPMARLRPPKVRVQPVSFFSSAELSRLERACRGNSFEDRRDAATIAVLQATGIRLAEVPATALAAATFPLGRDCTVSYELAPMTWKDELTKMWWGQLTPIIGALAAVVAAFIGGQVLSQTRKNGDKNASSRGET